ncbi:hypothetical protein AAG565_13345 [Fontimonas sp. SYSU GA230001]|uniref:hypothetical protein n=1 Tax=Fontimonas sp. SYSU GA230001 TaxID=3142450 RepID=UPI0032B39885
MNDTLPSSGPAVLADPVPLSDAAFRLVAEGVRRLWARIVAADPAADSGPLLLSYDVHPTPGGPVLIEVNTNAGGVLSAISAARAVNNCCPDCEQDRLRARLLELFKRDLLGPDPDHCGIVAIVDDHLASQPLLGEMQALAALMRPHADDVRVLDAGELRYEGGRLRHGATAIDRVYWRSTDFTIEDPEHAAVRRALDAGAITLAPSPDAWRAIADKRRFVEWSHAPELSRDAGSGLTFRIAQTVPMATQTLDAWYAERRDWVFKPVSGHASKGVYVGKSISRSRLAELPAGDYLAQRYAPHPVIDRNGQPWKYDVRFFADRGEIIGAAARVFQGQVVGLRTPGSGFAPVRIGDTCCLTGALLDVAAR